MGLTQAQPDRVLPRVLRLFDFSVLSSASMAPAYSLAATMGGMIAVAGNASILALLLMTGVMALLALSFAAMSRHYPNAGSSYAWMERAFGYDVGAFGAWLAIISTFFAVLATAEPAAIYTLSQISKTHMQDRFWVAGTGAVWTIVSVALLYYGVRPTALVTTLALLFEIGVLLASAIAAAFHPHVVAHASNVQGANALVLSVPAFLYAATLAIWMSDGWEVSASTSEENIGDDRTSGRGGLTGLLLTSAILIVCMIAYMRVGDVAGFKAHTDDALSYVASLLGQPFWGPLIVWTVLVSSCATLWTSVLYLSRGVFAMGRNGVLPHALGRLDARNEPFWALVVIGAGVTIFQLLTAFSPTVNSALQLVINGASVFLGLQFIGASLASIRLFWNTPSERWRGVVAPAIGAAALVFILAVTVAREAADQRWTALGGIICGLLFVLLVRRFGRRLVPAGAGPAHR